MDFRISIKLANKTSDLVLGAGAGDTAKRLRQVSGFAGSLLCRSTIVFLVVRKIDSTIRRPSRRRGTPRAQIALPLVRFVRIHHKELEHLRSMDHAAARVRFVL
jgi:hypothetical protein